MSRGDSKPFVTYRKSDGMGRMVQRVADGLSRTLYSQVDYEKLKMQTLEQHYSSHKSFMKLQKFEQVSKQSKETTLLKQHHLVWRKEFLRLNNIRRRLEHDLEAYLQENQMSPDSSRTTYEEFNAYAACLNSAFAKFKTNTVDPVWCLREDLQFWQKKNRSELEICSPAILESSKVIKEMMASVREQQRLVMDRLVNEEAALTQDLNVGFLKEISLTKKCPIVDKGIPEETFKLNCPDQQLRAAVLQEFLWLDEKYETRFLELEIQHRDVLLSAENDGWSKGDHYVFTCMCDQYTSDTPNRRQLLVDRLRRHLPHKTRVQIVSHEMWYLSHQYYHGRRHAVSSDWSRDKHELMTKAAVVFMEAELVHEYDDTKCETAEKQRVYCRQLADKVSAWRELKAEAMILEEELERRQMEEVRQEAKLLSERDAQKRQSIKKQIDTYKEDKDNVMKDEERRVRERLAKLNVLLAEQAQHDSERVQYRVSETENKNEAAKQKEIEREWREMEKEERLEALRCQVRVVAPSDPVRTFQNTENWQHRVHPDPHIEGDLHKPLFDIHSFTSNQITNDNRVKLEDRLRQAGLLESVYARQALAMVAPPQAPRKDMASTVFKHTPTQ